MLVFDLICARLFLFVCLFFFFHIYITHPVDCAKPTHFYSINSSSSTVDITASVFFYADFFMYNNSNQNNMLKLEKGKQKPKNKKHIFVLMLHQVHPALLDKNSKHLSSKNSIPWDQMDLSLFSQHLGGSESGFGFLVFF